MIEFAWLVETVKDNQVVYWGKTIEGLGFTSENLDAIRFKRKEDAQTVAACLLEECNAVEHSWG